MRIAAILAFTVGCTSSVRLGGLAPGLAPSFTIQTQQAAPPPPQPQQMQYQPVQYQAVAPVQQPVPAPPPQFVMRVPHYSDAERKTCEADAMAVDAALRYQPSEELQKQVDFYDSQVRECVARAERQKAAAAPALVTASIAEPIATKQESVEPEVTGDASTEEQPAPVVHEPSRKEKARLAAEVAARRERRQAELEAKTKARAEARAAKAERDRISDETICGDAPVRSEWSGAYDGIKDLLRSQANDPDSIVIQVCQSKPNRNPAPLCWGVECRWRGKNGFGALIVKDSVFTKSMLGWRRIMDR